MSVGFCTPHLPAGRQAPLSILFPTKKYAKSVGMLKFADGNPPFFNNPTQVKHPKPLAFTNFVQIFTSSHFKVFLVSMS